MLLNKTHYITDEAKSGFIKEKQSLKPMWTYILHLTWTPTFLVSLGLP
jgi:hypothetical protein